MTGDGHGPTAEAGVESSGGECKISRGDQLRSQRHGRATKLIHLDVEEAGVAGIQSGVGAAGEDEGGGAV